MPYVKGFLNIVSSGSPDQSLPGEQPGMDNSLPGFSGSVDNSLPPPPGIWPPPEHISPLPVPPGYPMPPGSIWPPVNVHRPDQSLPGTVGNRPDQSLPSGPADSTSPKPQPSNKFLVAIVTASANGGLRVIGYTVVDPSLSVGFPLPGARPDQSLPGHQPGIDNTLPGNITERPDQGLPPSAQPKK